MGVQTCGEHEMHISKIKEFVAQGVGKHEMTQFNNDDTGNSTDSASTECHLWDIPLDAW